MSFSEVARAKVNLTLHVIGQRGDGYHLLDSLVVFPRIGDLIEVEDAKGLSLTIDGPFAQDLGTGEDNLVVRAAEMIRPVGQGAAIHLTKSLPIASGIGGGSADAAAALRALSQLWGVDLEAADVLSLGADVPVCLPSQPVRMEGIGERLTPIDGLPAFWLVLVNPGRPVSTPLVFEGLATKRNSPMEVPKLDGFGQFITWLKTQRNDLQGPAIALEPSIAEVLTGLERMPGCDLARMSGSGATCFGVFETQEAALSARTALCEQHPTWWSVAAPV